MKKRTKNGQSLVEVLAALAIAVLVILALVKAVTVAVRNASFARNQALATKYAEEGMEWIRSQRDKRWENLSERLDTTYCLNVLSWASGSPCPKFALDDTFKREVTLTKPVTSQDKIKAQVIVSWQEGGRTPQSQLYSYFTKW